MKNEFKGLRHYIDIVEGKDQQVDEAGFIDALGNFVKGGAQLGGNIVGNVVQGAKDVGNAVSGAVGGAYDAAKNAVSGAADAVSGAVAPVVQAAQTGYNAATGEPAPAAAQQSASPKPNASKEQPKPGAPKPANTQAKPAAGKGDPAVLKIQQDLIAKGAKIKADGIMGPATQAAMKQFGGQAASPAAPQATDQRVNADSQQGQMLAAQTAGMNEPAQGQGASPSNATANTTGAPANMGAPAVAGGYGNPWEGKDPAKAAAYAKMTPAQQKWLGGADPTDPAILNRMPTNESAGYDEIQRLVSLVHYK